MDRARRLIVAALFVIPLVALADSVAGSSTAVEQSVTLKIDYGTGVQKQYTVSFKIGMTVFDAMKAAEGMKPPLRFEHKGSGDTVFISSIDGFDNQGGGKDKKNWLYYVNGKFADRSCGAYELHASDEAAWHFEGWEKHQEDDN